MEFKDGSKIFTQEGKEVGSLQRVVFDPDTNEATHIVIQKGLIFGSDKVVPVDNVASTTQGKVFLNCSLKDLEELPSLDVEKILPESERIRPRNVYMPMMGGGYPFVIEEPDLETQIERTIPENLVALKEGARVLSQDGDHVGKIERVYTDPHTGDITHFVVSHGLLMNGRKSIPVQLVKVVDEDEIQLNIRGQEFKDLPEYQK